MTSDTVLRRALAVATSVVAAAGIVSAGLVADPVWSQAALERAEVVASPDAFRVTSTAASEPVLETVAIDLAAAPVAEPEPAEAPEPVPPAPDPAPAPAPEPPAATPAPAPAPAPATAPAPAAEPAPVPPAQPAASQVGARDVDCEASMLRWMNESRVAAGRHALAWDDAIVHVPVDWSHDMAARSQLAHNPGYGDRVFAARAEAMTAAENVGWGTGTARGVYDEFLRSPSHKDKILSGALTHTAVACVRDGAGEVWVTVNFWG